MESTMVAIAVVDPIPIATVRIAAIVNARFLVSVRTEMRISLQKPMQPPPESIRHRLVANGETAQVRRDGDDSRCVCARTSPAQSECYHQEIGPASAFMKRSDAHAQLHFFSRAF
jgi:hypothetical protein